VRGYVVEWRDEARLLTLSMVATASLYAALVLFGVFPGAGWMSGGNGKSDSVVRIPNLTASAAHRSAQPGVRRSSGRRVAQRARGLTQNQSRPSAFGTSPRTHPAPGARVSAPSPGPPSERLSPPPSSSSSPPSSSQSPESPAVPSLSSASGVVSSVPSPPPTTASSLPPAPQPSPIPPAPALPTVSVPTLPALPVVQLPR
jgi:hypothetical protein